MDHNKEIADLRQDYKQASLELEDVNKNPFLQFRKWFDESVASEVREPNAMVLSTSGSNNSPSQRTVLMKALNSDSIVFYTNYSSRKAGQIDENKNVSVLFPWYALERQVIMEGKAEKISKAESLKYFLSRPFGSQLGAWVSNQSQIISSRAILEEKLAQMKRKFQEGKVPLPDDWGGYKITAHRIEFWQGRSNRLHDRILYELEDSTWKIQRLAP